MNFGSFTFFKKEGKAFSSREDDGLQVGEKEAGDNFEFVLESTKIVGMPEDGFWGQVHCFNPQEEEKKKKRGQLLAVLTVGEVEEGLEAVETGREVLRRLHEEYYGNLEGSAFERLTEAVEGAKGEASEVEIVAASVVGRAMFLAIAGGGKIVLKRDGELGVVLQGKSEASEVVTGSGYLQEGDLVLLGSESFFETMEGGVLRAALESGSPQEAGEIISPLVMGREGTGRMVAVFVLFKKVEKTEIPLISEEEVKLTGEGKEVRERSRYFSLLQKIGEVFSFLRRKRFYVVRREERKKRRALFWLSGILILIIGSSLFFGYKRKTSEDEAKRAEKIFLEAKEKFEAIRQIYGQDPGKGRVLLEEVKRLIDEGLRIKGDERDLALLKSEIEKFVEEVGEEKDIGELPLFMDLALIEDGAVGEEVSLSGRALLILDKGKGKVYSLDREKKSFSVYDAQGGVKVVGEEDKMYILGEEGVWEVNLLNKKTSLKVRRNSNLEEIVAIGTFNQNLYLLDKKAQEIWKYTGSEEGFVGGGSWFSGRKPDLFSAVDFGIDGSIWVLTEKGILKLTLGREEDFSLKMMPEGFGKPVALYTAWGMKNLYILDKERKKIYVVDKEGNFKKSFFGEKIGEANDLVVLEEEGKIYLLAVKKIYLLEMKK